MSNEHVFPRWLVRRTGTDKTSIRWIDGTKIDPRQQRGLWICRDCNQRLNTALEQPVQLIFDRLEGGRGLNDYDADVLVRWLWKIQRMLRYAHHPGGRFVQPGKLVERLTYPLGRSREGLTLAIALIATLDPDYGDAPLGIDVQPEYSGILAAGVFSRVALIVSATEFADGIPGNYARYRFPAEAGTNHEPRLMVPTVGFRDDTVAVGTTLMTATALLSLHEEVALRELHDLGIQVEQPRP